MGKTLDAAKGRWPEIIGAIAGVSGHFLIPSKKEGPCPSCGGVTRYRWISSDEDGSWFCSHCGGKKFKGGGGNGIDLLIRLKNWSFQEACTHVDHYLGGLASSPAWEPTKKPPRSTIKLPRLTERIAFDYLDEAGQIGENEVGFVSTKVGDDSYVARWKAWSQKNEDLATSIILEANLTKGIIDPLEIENNIDKMWGKKKTNATKLGPITLDVVREHLLAAMEKGSSNSDLEQLVTTLANQSEQQPNSIRQLLLALQKEQDYEDQIAVQRQRLIVAADRAEIGAALITLKELFPKSIAEAIALKMKYLPSDDITSAGVFLATTAGVVKLGCEVIASQALSFVVPMNLYVAMVGFSGVKKGPVEKILMELPMDKIRTDLSHHNARAFQDWKQSNHGVKPLERTDPPLNKYIVVSQFTGESLDRQLAIQERAGMGLLVHRDEIKGMFGSFNAYRGGRGGDSEQLLELYDGRGSTTLRITSDGQDRSYGKCQLSIFGTIQPDILNKLVADGDASGLWARFLFLPLPGRVVPLPAEESDEEVQASQAAAALLENVISNVYRLPPKSLRLDHQARRVFMDYEARCQGDALRADLDAQRAAWSKAPGKALRVAGLLHLLHEVSSDGEHSKEISQTMITRAFNFVDYLTGWSLGIHQAASDREATDVMRMVHSISERKGEPVGWRIILQNMSKKQRQAVDSAAALAASQALAEIGYGELKASGKGWQYKATKTLPD